MDTYPFDDQRPLARKAFAEILETVRTAALRSDACSSGRSDRFRETIPEVDEQPLGHIQLSRYNVGDVGEPDVARYLLVRRPCPSREFLDEHRRIDRVRMHDQIRDRARELRE